MKKQTLFITRTAMFIAILIVMQVLTKSLGQLVTGSCVNMILAVCAITCGVGSAAAVAVISPFMAFLLGIGTPIIQLVPLIALGNLVYVVIISFLGSRFSGQIKDLVAIVIAAMIKFAVLYISITRIALPLIGLPEAKAAVISASFSWPQLVTALIGGLVAREICNLIRKSKKVSG